MRRALAPLALLLLAAAAPPPPAIRPHGIVNASGRMPASLPGGALAPGARILIRGWRLVSSPEPSRVLLTQGSSTLPAQVLSATEREILAVLPPSLAPGAAQLRVVSSDGPSIPFALTLAASAFQPDPFTPWSRTPAHPGDTIELSGTGLGPTPAALRVSIGGVPAPVLASGPLAAPGRQFVRFALPANAPLGCNVPAVVLTAGVPSNPAFLQIAPPRQPCPDDLRWLEDLGLAPRTALLLLLRASIRLDLEGRNHSDFTLDTAYAAFRQRSDPERAQAPLYMLPPPGACTLYTGDAHLRNLVSPLSALDLAGGTPLDAGPALALESPLNRASLAPTPGHAQDYSAILGGNAPLPRFQSQPLFFRSPAYTWSIPGGPGAGPARLSTPASLSLVWTNRGSLASIDRRRGFTARWRSRGPVGAVLVFAVNIDQPSGATAVSLCRATPAAGRFHVPPEALANLPPTTAEDTMPFSSVFLAALPSGDNSASIPKIDRAAAFFVAADGRTVRFR